MNRNQFLKLPLLTLAMTAGANAIADERPKRGFKVESGRDRFQEELHIMGGTFNCIISAKDTEGDLCIYNTVRQEKGGPAFHLHHKQDEWFYVMKGDFIVKVGEDTFSLKPGDSAFAPRTIPHAFASVGEGESQMLVLFQPAGTMEDFFREMGKLGSSVSENQRRLQKDLWEAHGMKVVGPPLKF